MNPGISLLDPTAPGQATLHAKRPVLNELRGKMIGFVDNSKPNFDVLADEMAKLLKTRHSADSIVHRKHLASIPASQEMIDDLVQRCDVVITGSGD